MAKTESDLTRKARAAAARFLRSQSDDPVVRASDDLLAACRSALRKLRGTNIMGEEIEPRVCAKLRAAIAKATAPAVETAQEVKP